MNRRRLLVTAAAAAAAPLPSYAQDGLEDWLVATEARALLAGVSQTAMRSARDGLAFNDSLIRPAGAQPESRRVGRYVQALITGDGPIARRKLGEFPAIGDVERRFGVPASVLVAFWGRETGYGRDLGNLDVFSTLATLGYARQGRSDWAMEYVAALRILDAGVRPRAGLRGSMAGAMGHTQLMPSSYLTYGEDFDGDGRVDVWSASPLDALASAARHVQEAPAAGPPIPRQGRAWKTGQGWIVPVTLPSGFDLNRVEVDEGRLELREWERSGVRSASGWRDEDRDAPARLALPAGASGPALLLLPNFDVFERYNPSRTYALGVGLLARHIDGEPPVAWPEEQPLSIEDRQAAQRALAALGHYTGPIDGDLGSGSRRALRIWQRARGLAADGYLTGDMVAALKRG